MFNYSQCANVLDVQNASNPETRPAARVNVKTQCGPWNKNLPFVMCGTKTFKDKCSRFEGVCVADKRATRFIVQHLLLLQEPPRKAMKTINMEFYANVFFSPK